MPGYSGRVRNADRLRLRALSATGRATRAAGAATSRSAIGRGLRRAAHLAAQQAYVHVPPATLFGADRCDLHGRLDRTLLAVSIDEPGIELVPIPGSEVAARMRHSIQHERLDLLEQYLKFRFAFPHATNQRIEDAAERTGALLEAALSGRPAAVLRHPYPAPIPEMVEAVRPWLA